MLAKVEIKALYKQVDLPLNYRMHLWYSLCALYLLVCQVRSTAGNSRLCCFFV